MRFVSLSPAIIDEGIYDYTVADNGTGFRKALALDGKRLIGRHSLEIGIAGRT